MLRIIIPLFIAFVGQVTNLLVGQPIQNVLHAHLEFVITDDSAHEQTLIYPAGTTYEVYNESDELIASSLDKDTLFSRTDTFTLVIDPTWTDELQYISVKNKRLVIRLKPGKGQEGVSKEYREAQRVKELENSLEGTWKIDLRQSPDARAYFQSLTIERVNNKTFQGEFYGSKIEKALVNTEWDNLHIGFATKDKNNTYYHTATLRKGVLRGKTYCPQRGFVAPWTGKLQK